MNKPAGDRNVFRDLNLKTSVTAYSDSHVSWGIPIPKTKRIELFSPDEWEEFVEEWASSLKSLYHRVVRFAGPGDTGLDVVGLINGDTLADGYDNYQCKHYDKALAPSDVWLEIGKVVFYSYSGEYPIPRRYYFVAPKGIGTRLSKLLSEPEYLKQELRNNWAKYCENGLSSKHVVPLTGALQTYFETIEFSIFSWKTAVELIDGHFKTSYHTVRFGGGLRARPADDKPPVEIAQAESRYVQQIFAAYTDHDGEPIDAEAVDQKPELRSDFLRQRERFYHAESLRNFARDTVPEGTFEALQEDIFQGVVEVTASHHEDGLARMRATIVQSARLPVTSSPLSSVTRVQDKQGICHQLANVDRLTWVHKEET